MSDTGVYYRDWSLRELGTWLSLAAGLEVRSASSGDGKMDVQCGRTKMS